MNSSLKADGSSKNNVLLFSILFMGLGHIRYFKQYITGALFALVEVIFIAFSPVLFKKIYEISQIGKSQAHIHKLDRIPSHNMLIDGILCLAIVAIFIIIYIISVRGSLDLYREYCIDPVIKTNKNSFSKILGKSFPVVGLAPAVGLIIFFVIVPLVFSALVAFTNYDNMANGTEIPFKWVGFENFNTMFGGNLTWTSSLWRVVIWTFVWAVCATFTCYFGGLLMAVVLNEYKFKLTPFFRTIFILPYAVPAIISLMVWRQLLNGAYGTVNQTLQHWNIIDQNINWLTDPMLTRFTVILINLWAGFPYFMLLITGTMTAISADVFEAARIDGANGKQIFRRITLPLVLYQTTPLMIMSFTHNINNFGAVFFLTGGGPTLPDTTVSRAGATDIIITWIYNLTINENNFKFASVLAILVFVILAPLAIINFRQTKSYKEGEV